MNLFEDIINFHKKFELHNPNKPSKLEMEMLLYRINFMLEELNEYIAASHNNNLEEAFDALIDLVYVALGTAYLHGFPFNEGWKLVHDANMQKIKTPHKDLSKRSSVFDIIKPDGWIKPGLSDLIRRLNDKE